MAAISEKVQEAIRQQYAATDAEGRPMYSMREIAKKNKVDQSTAQGYVQDLPPRTLRKRRSTKPVKAKKRTSNQKKIDAANAKLAPAASFNALVKQFIAGLKKIQHDVSEVEILVKRTERLHFEVK